MKVVDAGDLLMPGSDLVASLEVLAQATEKISLVYLLQLATYQEVN